VIAHGNQKVNRRTRLAVDLTEVDDQLADLSNVITVQDGEITSLSNTLATRTDLISVSNIGLYTNPPEEVNLDIVVRNSSTPSVDYAFNPGVRARSMMSGSRDI
jgi:hypothetical protein